MIALKFISYLHTQRNFLYLRRTYNFSRTEYAILRCTYCIISAARTRWIVWMSSKVGCLTFICTRGMYSLKLVINFHHGFKCFWWHLFYCNQVSFLFWLSDWNDKKCFRCARLSLCPSTNSRAYLKSIRKIM